MTTWYTADENGQARLLAAWEEAPIGNAEVCGFILTVARDQVIAWAPEPAPVPQGEPVPDPPDNLVYAQLQQAINLWNAGRVDSSGDVGEGGFVFVPRPLDKTIRDIIRPKSGRLHVL